MQTYIHARRVYMSLLVALIIMVGSLGEARPIMAGPAEEANSEAKVYIIHTANPTNIEPKSYHLSTLSAALGSQVDAKNAMIRSYKEAASGFSAKLTPEQVDKVSKQPGVIKVVPSRTFNVSKPGIGLALP